MFVSLCAVSRRDQGVDASEPIFHCARPLIGGVELRALCGCNRACTSYFSIAHKGIPGVVRRCVFEILRDLIPA